MDTVVVYVCQKRSLDAELYSLTIPGVKTTVELDRTLAYYVDVMNIKEMNLVIGEKAFTTMIEKENDVDVMIYQYVQEKF